MEKENQTSVSLAIAGIVAAGVAMQQLELVQVQRDGLRIATRAIDDTGQTAGASKR